MKYSSRTANQIMHPEKIEEQLREMDLGEVHIMDVDGNVIE